MISVFGQFSGNGLGYFNATIFEQIGIKTVSQQLAYNLLNSVLSAVVSTGRYISCIFQPSLQSLWGGDVLLRRGLSSWILAPYIKF